MASHFPIHSTRSNPIAGIMLALMISLLMWAAFAVLFIQLR